MFSRFYFPCTRTIFSTVSQKYYGNRLLFRLFLFFQCEEKKLEKFLGYGNNRKQAEKSISLTMCIRSAGFNHFYYAFMLVSMCVMNKVFTLVGFYLVLTKVVEILDTIQQPLLIKFHTFKLPSHLSFLLGFVGDGWNLASGSLTNCCDKF